MRQPPIQTLTEIREENEEGKRRFIQGALAGEATWGAWRYNPDNLRLEIDSKISDYPKNNPFYVDLEQCNNSNGILNCLLQLLGKQWCPKEQVGYLLQAIYDLADDLYRVIDNRHFNMGKHLREMRVEGGEKLLTVGEVAEILRVSKITIYRKVKDKKINVLRLPKGRFGVSELRIPETEVKKLLSERSVKTRDKANDSNI